MSRECNKRTNNDVRVTHQGHVVKKSALIISSLSPEATGVIGASVYILLLALFAPLPYLAHLLPSASNVFPALNMTSSLPDLSNQLSMDQAIDFPHHSFATYLASLFSLLIATFLGFLDDVFDIRWRFKLPIPSRPTVALKYNHAITDYPCLSFSHRLRASPRNVRGRTWCDGRGSTQSFRT